MEPKIIIEKILQASTIEEVLDVHKIKEEYKHIMLLIHPDKCSLPNASDATSKLNELKRSFEAKREKEILEYYNDAGQCIIRNNSIIQEGDITLLEQSLANYNKLMAFTDSTARAFQRYLPAAMEIKNGKLHISLAHRSVSLSCLTLPQGHVNWILSRMLEIIGWFEEIGYTHCDINPESVLVVPETHGIIISSFFFMTKTNQPLTRLSERYSFWFDDQVLASKKAIPAIDIQLCKKTALYLLGDPSGEGSTVTTYENKAFMQFIQSYSTNAFDTYDAYRQMLRTNYDTKKYHPLYL